MTRQNQIHPTKISPNGHFLRRADETPFFYLADTAWELFHRCSRDEAETYLQKRAAQGFTVIQAVVLAELDGLNFPNAQGHVPLQNNDPTRPIEAYFEDVDFVVRRANQLGLTIALLPTWGDKWNRAWGVGPEVFTPQNARQFGSFLAKRCRDDAIIWVLGGDRKIESAEQRAIIDAMSQGLREGDGGAHLQTFHPVGGHGSREQCPDASWLDFDMWQSGHDRNKNNYDLIAQDYNPTPPRPVLDAEPGYENHPASFDPENGYLDAYDCRKSLWWALLAGACGHSYGCHDIWQMWQPGRAAVSWARTSWKEALDFPGAQQMQHAKNLLLSRPYETRVPDQTLVTDNGTGTRRNAAARDENGRYAFIYIPMQGEVKLDLSSLATPHLNASWFDPRNGTSQCIGNIARDTSVLQTPVGGPDWVLVLDALEV